MTYKDFALGVNNKLASDIEIVYTPVATALGLTASEWALFVNQTFSDDDLDDRFKFRVILLMDSITTETSEAAFGSPVVKLNYDIYVQIDTSYTTFPDGLSVLAYFLKTFNDFRDRIYLLKSYTDRGFYWKANDFQPMMSRAGYNSYKFSFCVKGNIEEPNGQ